MAAQLAPGPTAASPISVLVAGPSGMARAGLRWLFGRDRRFRMLAETAVQPSETARRYGADLIVLDPAQGGRFEPELIAELHESAPASRIAILTSHAELPSCAAAIHAGALGYFLPTFAALGRPFLDALFAIGRYGVGVSDPAIVAAFQASRGTTLMGRAATEGGRRLTKQECRVLRLAADGLDDEQIGAQLNIDQRTVEYHFAEARLRLGATNRFHLACLAKDLGLL